jgi:hypothetical protein
MTAEGILRSNTGGTPFFQQARDALIKAGFNTTTWVDYVTGTKGVELFFVTIKKNKIVVDGTNGFLFSTTKLQRVVDLLC